MSKFFFLLVLTSSKICKKQKTFEFIINNFLINNKKNTIKKQTLIQKLVFHCLILKPKAKKKRKNSK